MDRVDGGFVLPALTRQFAADDGAMLSNRLGKFLGQIKVAPDAFVIGTSKTEHGLGILKVDHVLELTALGGSFCVIIPDVYDQRLQLPKFVRKAG